MCDAEWVYASARGVQEEPHCSCRTTAEVRRFHRSYNRGV